MVMVAHALRPSAVWLTGASQMTTRHAILKGVPEADISCYHRAEDIPLAQVPAGKVVFAVGNLAGPGLTVMKWIREEAAEYV
jgi:hypothetical protein